MLVYFRSRAAKATVHRCLQPFTEQGLFMSIFFTKITGLQPKQRLRQDFFQWVCLILQNIFLQKLFGWWMVLLNTIHFLCWVDLISKILLSTLAMFWLSLNISRINMVRRLWRAVSGSPRQLVDLLVMKQAICRKCS